MKRYPVENGIAISPLRLDLPDSRFGWDNEKKKNNHHAHFTSTQFGRVAVTQCLRDLDRHQYALPVDVHNFIHDEYLPPSLPTSEQAAREVIDAYDKGEYFKRYDYALKRYRYDEIPLELIDRFIAKYGLQRVFSMAAD